MTIVNTCKEPSKYDIKRHVDRRLLAKVVQRHLTDDNIVCLRLRDKKDQGEWVRS